MDLIKPYKKEFSYSYTLGAFPTIELIENCPELVTEVILSPALADRKLIIELCKNNNIKVTESQKQIERLSDKENVFIIGIFRKKEEPLCKNCSHIVLVNPSNMGNLGTIFRTALGFGIRDVALIQPAADFFHPKVVRASMGAMFHMRVQYFASFDEYSNVYGKKPDSCRIKENQQQDAYERLMFPFMLGEKQYLSPKLCPKDKLFSLIFGNEASGLDESFLKVGTPIMIPQSEDVDSLNITIAVAVAAYIFTYGSR